VQQVNLLNTEQENNTMMEQMTKAKKATDIKTEEATQKKQEIEEQL
jgi:hypothetical protein